MVFLRVGLKPENIQENTIKESLIISSTLNMPEFKTDYARDKWEETRRKIRDRRLGNKKFIWEMTLKEALEAKRKYLEWEAKGFPNADKYTVDQKQHMYKTYLLPHIKKLTQQLNEPVTVQSPTQVAENMDEYDVMLAVG